MRLLWLTLGLCLLLPAGCARRTDPAYIAEVDQWHQERLDRLTAADGWLTLVGLHPLHAGLNTVGTSAEHDVRLADKAPAQLGVITVGPGQILFSAYPGAAVTLAGQEDGPPLVGTELATDRSGQPTVLAAGPLLMHVIDRDGLLFLRVKDREAETLRSFTGVDRFAVDRKWRVTAHLEPGPATLTVPNVLGQKSESPSPGVLVFKLAGRECRLTPEGEPGGPLFIVFGDATNGEATYGGGRFLSAAAPAADGTVVLDFNRAVNPPCVFSPYATCPLPPPDNLLPVAVAAGEKLWGHQH